MFKKTVLKKWYKKSLNKFYFFKTVFLNLYVGIPEEGWAGGQETQVG
jgi:hypothetical protein